MIRMMRITMRPGIKRAAAVSAALLGLLLGSGRLEARPGERLRAPDYAVAFEAGLFRAEQAPFRTLYGNGPVVFSCHLRARLYGGLWAVAGWRMLKAEGRTALAGPAFDDESYALKFSMTSFRLGLRYAHEFGRLIAFVGGGGSANRFEERWTDVPGLGGSGKEPGWYAEAGGEFAAARFLAFFLRGEYSSVPTGRGSVLEPDVNLGGWEATAGLAIRF